MIEGILKARKAITDKHGDKKPPKFIRDLMDCPVCEDGTLRYTISDYNGHIHAGCTKEGCVNWME